MNKSFTDFLHDSAGDCPTANQIISCYVAYALEDSHIRKSPAMISALTVLYKVSQYSYFNHEKYGDYLDQ